jgi:uncharacterized repeat protein (TIGR03803 family)
VNGTLYGTTTEGGSRGFGTVFSVSTSGKEHVIYSFQGDADGAAPWGDLIELNGALYGTTQDGGLSSSATCGCGTVFAVSPSGAEHVIYRFKSGTDGANPLAGLTAVAGTLYGTTTLGGLYGHGTVFEVSTSGTEQVVHNFKGGKDGADPQVGLTYANGSLYGATFMGGGAHKPCISTNGCGTIFELTP